MRKLITLLIIITLQLGNLMVPSQAHAVPPEIIIPITGIIYGVRDFANGNLNLGNGHNPANDIRESYLNSLHNELLQLKSMVPLDGNNDDDDGDSTGGDNGDDDDGDNSGSDDDDDDDDGVADTSSSDDDFYGDDLKDKKDLKRNSRRTRF